MKLSIITVNLNNRDGLQKTIDSVICQTFRDFEWIVIDGGSTDGSKALIEQYTDYFAYWVSEPDKGIYNAMNKGIRGAKGEYLQFLNSGDWYCDKDSLAKTFDMTPLSDIIYTDCNLIKNDKIIETRRYPDFISLKEILDLNICHNCIFLRKDLFDNNLYNEELQIVSDLKFLLERLLENRSFEHVPTTLINYDLNGFSTLNPDLSYKEKLKVIREVIPPSIQKDLQNIDYLSEHKKDSILEKVDYYRNHCRFYHKLVTTSILLMNFLFRLSPKLKCQKKK